MVTSERAELRRVLRAARRSLSDAQRRRANAAICRRLLGAPWFRRCRRIACYLAFDSEPNLDHLLHSAAGTGRIFFLPLLTPGHKLRFARHRPGAVLRRNRFGIGEPAVAARDCRAAPGLDLVLLPLVGFDAQGNRLGMGGGYYDRTLAFKRHSPTARPLLVGVGYDCQRVPSIPAQPWDVSLDAVVTETACYRFALPPDGGACSNSSPLATRSG